MLSLILQTWAFLAGLFQEEVCGGSHGPSHFRQPAVELPLHSTPRGTRGIPLAAVLFKCLSSLNVTVLIFGSKVIIFFPITTLSLLSSIYSILILL